MTNHSRCVIIVVKITILEVTLLATYVVSDIHGCYKEFKSLLEKIEFSDDDTLFILGDVLDRGPEPISVIKDIMGRENVFFLKGNHEVMALDAFDSFLGVEITEKNIDNLSDDAFFPYFAWLENGGDTTMKQLSCLPHEERVEVLEFIRESYDYDALEVDGKLYILVHAGLRNFAPDKELDEYTIEDIVWDRPDYDKRYYPSERIFLVTGHTPTQLIRHDRQPLVFRENGHIAIDCGCHFGGRLAAYCFETGEVTYVDSEKMKS